MNSLQEKQRYLLTIAVPTYNGSKTITNMLNILLPQVFNKIEVIVCDNCSTDNTREIIENYKKKYNFIKYYRNESNIGADGNFLKCMRKASGKFTMLISDDDILVEGAIKKIVDFLDKYPQTQLAYLESVGFKNNYVNVEKCHYYNEFSPSLVKSISTTDKSVFLHYAQRLWGFTSSYIWNTERFRRIKEPEQYFGTYFLQSYIHIGCSNKKEDLLGVIKGPCVAIGEYGIIGNYDTALVEGVFYRKMMTFAIDKGYDKRQLEKYYKWKLDYLTTRAIIKEKVANVNNTRKRSVVMATKRLPLLRVKLLSLYIVPRKICVMILTQYRKKRHLSAETYVNRPTK